MSGYVDWVGGSVKLPDGGRVSLGVAHLLTGEHQSGPSVSRGPGGGEEEEEEEAGEAAADCLCTEGGVAIDCVYSLV